MTQSTSYETDYLRWLDTQARHLRSGEMDQLDRVHLLEELEGMSRSERRQLRNRLIVLVQHLLKLRYQRQRRSLSWDVTIITQRVDIKLLLKESPSLRPTLAATLGDIYATAHQEAARETGLDIDNFPEQSPFTLDQVLDDEWWPDAVDGEG